MLPVLWANNSPTAKHQPGDLRSPKRGARAGQGPGLEATRCAGARVLGRSHWAGVVGGGWWWGVGGGVGRGLGGWGWGWTGVGGGGRVPRAEGKAKQTILRRKKKKTKTKKKNGGNEHRKPPETTYRNEDMAMSQKPNRTPLEHPNPTTNIPTKMGGEFTNQPKWYRWF